MLSIFDFMNTEPMQIEKGALSELEPVRPEEPIRKFETIIHSSGEIYGTERSVSGLRNVVDLTQVAAQVMPATVRIEGKRTSSTLYNNFGPAIPYDLHGSGFVVSKDGYVVTNHHLIDGTEKIKVIFGRSGRSFPAIVKGSDPETDIALLKIEGADFPYLSFADSNQVRVGESALLIGHPLGFRDLLTFGVIGGKASGLGNAYDFSYTQRNVGVYADYFISDALVNGGNSGGAVLNLHGEVIGVCAREGHGIGLHIASNTARGVVDELMRNGHVTRSYFGADLALLDEDFASMIKFEDPFLSGLVVNDVLKDSPAMLSGLQKGDIILKYNDIFVTTYHTFSTDVATKMAPGSELKLSILRDGALAEVIVVLGSRQVNVKTSIQNMGLWIENLGDGKSFWCDLDSDIEGVLISEVASQSPAGLAGLEPTDVIIGVVVSLGQEVKVRNVAEFQKVMEQLGERKTVVFIVRSPDRSRPVYCTVHL